MLRLDAIEELIRSGKARQARATLREVEVAKVPRKDLARLAELSRRAQLPLLSLKILHPVVRIGEDSNAAERAEYAASLTQVGCAQEALELLEGISPAQYPNALLFRAFANFSQWDYQAALKPLQQYIQITNLTPYRLLVGKVNLAAALVYENMFTQADTLLKEILEETQRNEHRLLQGNVLELLAQSAINQGFFGTAQQRLFEAQKLLEENAGLFSFFVRKWLAVVKLLQAAPGESAVLAANELKKLRLEAATLRHWESLRDCDRYEAIGLKDKGIALHLYFGTPYRSYQARLLQDFKEPLSIPTEFLFNFSRSMEPLYILDTVSGALVKKTDGLFLQSSRLPFDSGPLLQDVLRALASDFYAPFKLRGLFAQLFPGEKYDPRSSQRKVSRALLSLREALAAHEVPLNIEEEGGFYRLGSKERLALKLHHNKTSSKASHAA